MNKVAFISELPNVPAVYALYGGQGSRLNVAYVGIADALKRRIIQHLITRDSSVATGTSATGINPDYVTQVRWWEHPRFSEREVLRVAEVIATDELQPVLRSRGGVPKNTALLNDGQFRQEMASLFRGKATGQLVIPTFQDLIEWVVQIERRVSELEKRLPQQ